MIFDPNKAKYQMASSLGESQEKEISLIETPLADPAGQEKMPPLDFLPEPDAKPQETEISLFEIPLADPAGQENNLPVNLIPEPDTVPMQPVQQVKPTPEPSPVKTATPAKSAPAVSSMTPYDLIDHLPVNKSSTNSLMEVILPVEKPKIKEDTSTVQETDRKIIAVGGAKGGVGKSMFSANLAVGLALLGRKVVLADLDLGGADVHLYTGVKSLEKTWNDFLDKKVDSIKDILTPTAFKGLSLIGGDSSRLGSSNLPYAKKLKIMRHLNELETDFLVIDLGGDTSYNELDFFLLADQKIVVSGTEPASVLDSYAFVKVVFNRFLERFFTGHKSLKDLAEQIKDGSLEKSKKYSLEFIYQEIRVRDPQALFELKKQFNQFQLSIVLNMTESGKDVQIAQAMQKLIKDKCFLDIGFLGTIPFDKAARKAARRFTPIVVENPKCQVSRNIHQMLAAIIFNHEQEVSRTKLLRSTSRIRRGAKEQIDSGNMTLDGLTVEQINSIYNNTPRLRPSFQKILNIMGR